MERDDLFVEGAPARSRSMSLSGILFFFLSLSLVLFIFAGSPFLNQPEKRVATRVPTVFFWGERIRPLVRLD